MFLGRIDHAPRPASSPHLATSVVGQISLVDRVFFRSARLRWRPPWMRRGCLIQQRPQPRRLELASPELFLPHLPLPPQKPPESTAWTPPR
jgi:hypothetical protein